VLSYNEDASSSITFRLYLQATPTRQYMALHNEPFGRVEKFPKRLLRRIIGEVSLSFAASTVASSYNQELPTKYQSGVFFPAWKAKATAAAVAATKKATAE
jgi:hypothetical protein